MPSDETPLDDREWQDRLVSEARRARQRREQGYRARALKAFPWICAKCGREFSNKTLHELTVHHKDHNHDHNPPDGSNWELLCLSCHDNEHSRRDAAASEDEIPNATPSTYRPFADLETLLKAKK